MGRVLAGGTVRCGRRDHTRYSGCKLGRAHRIRDHFVDLDSSDERPKGIHPVQGNEAAYEARRHFSILETIILFLLIMADMLAAAYSLLMAAAP